VTLLPVRSCLIDGEAVVCDESGLAVFELIRGYRKLNG
jgi:ATP-dependent DNA ligase